MYIYINMTYIYIYYTLHYIHVCLYIPWISLSYITLSLIMCWLWISWHFPFYYSCGKATNWTYHFGDDMYHPFLAILGIFQDWVYHISYKSMKPWREPTVRKGPKVKLIYFLCSGFVERHGFHGVSVSTACLLWIFRGVLLAQRASPRQTNIENYTNISWKLAVVNCAALAASTNSNPWQQLVGHLMDG